MLQWEATLLLSGLKETFLKTKVSGNKRLAEINSFQANKDNFMDIVHRKFETNCLTDRQSNLVVFGNSNIIQLTVVIILRSPSWLYKHLPKNSLTWHYKTVAANSPPIFCLHFSAQKQLSNYSRIKEERRLKICWHN